MIKTWSVAKKHLRRMTRVCVWHMRNVGLNLNGDLSIASPFLTARVHLENFKIVHLCRWKKSAKQQNNTLLWKNVKLMSFHCKNRQIWLSWSGSKCVSLFRRRLWHPWAHWSSFGDDRPSETPLPPPRFLKRFLRHIRWPTSKESLHGALSEWKHVQQHKYYWRNVCA